MANYNRIGQWFRALASGSSESPFLPVHVVGSHQRTYDDYEKVTLSTGSVFTLSGKPSQSTHATIYCETPTPATDFVRYLHGPDNPTTTDGIKILDHEMIESADPATFAAIRGQASSCILHVEYYHYE